MKRDLLKLEENGNKIIKKHSCYDLNVGEMCKIIDSCSGVYDMFKIFYMGVEVGMRISKAEKKKKGKKGAKANE